MNFRLVARYAGVLGLMAASVASTWAQDGVAVDKDGDTVPSPTGNIPYFSMPGALVAATTENTWDYSGTLEGRLGKRFSFMSSIFDVNGTGGFGFHIFQFGWKEGDKEVYFNANSTYGGDSFADTLVAVAQSIDTVQSSATLEKFELTASTDASLGSTGWMVNSDGRTGINPLFKGWVGQPGHHYKLRGSGTTFLWRYAPDGSSTVVLYRYTVRMGLFDERGAIMEGMGGGYVGPALVPNPPTTSYNTESEIGQPRLRVTGWSVKLTAVDPIPAGQKGMFSATYEFEGKEGLLWNDFGPVVHKTVTSPPATAEYAAFRSQLPTDVATQVDQAASSSKAQGLYNGNWLPVHFTKGKYEGCTLVGTVFWNKYAPRPANQTTDSFAWSQAGWINLYTGLIPDKPGSASTVTASLYLENPTAPKHRPLETPPYTISLDTFVPPVYTSGTNATISFPWAQTVTIKIHPRTKLRYALADYANTYFPLRGPDNPNEPLVIKLKAISPVSQNTLFSPSVSQYFEGAAVPYVDDKVVGYGWIEHMISEAASK